MGTDPASTITKEMGISHKDFLRILPRVVDGAPCRIAGQRIEIGEGERRVEIVLSDERVRALGPIVKLPVTQVTLSFYGFSQADQAEFLEKYDFNYFRGGG